MNYWIQFSYISHTGNFRHINQDNFICNGQYMEIKNGRIKYPVSGRARAKPPAVFGVFDGMGGEECGEIASYIAARNAAGMIFGKNASLSLMEYCLGANEEICRYAKDKEITSMGTTAAMVAFFEKNIGLCNIGDSKIFRFSKGRLEQLSRDHVMISAYGVKPPLSQNLGIPKSELLIDPYIAQGKYCHDDIYLMCTDGLTDMVSDDEIIQIMNESRFCEVTQNLLDRALCNGGKDNITILGCKVKRNGIGKVVQWY